MKRIEIGVGSLKQAAGAFADLWRRAEAGERLPEATARVDFGSLPELLAVLSPKRLELLEAIKRDPGESIRALSRSLGRDYKNVHEDVTALAELGLIVRNKAGRLAAPYDELVIRAPLTRAA